MVVDRKISRYVNNIKLKIYLYASIKITRGTYISF